MLAPDAVPFDWASFYALFWNDKGVKAKINIPDTVIFRFGQLSAWWSTNKQGCIQRHTSQSTSLEAIRKRFLSVAHQDDSNCSKFVAISWLGSGKPQLLRVMAFNQLCELLSDRLEAGRPDDAPEIETPMVLQAFIQPWQDLRYVTTYINTGTAVTCHTFQRKYSRRYTPMSAATAAQVDSRDADIVLAVGQDTSQRIAEIEAHQGAVEPALKMQLRKLTAHLVKYIQRAHGLTLGSVVCEYIRDADGKIYLTSILRTEWTSNAMGHGAGSLNAATYHAPVTELPDHATQPTNVPTMTAMQASQGGAQGAADGTGSHAAVGHTDGQQQGNHDNEHGNDQDSDDGMVEEDEGEDEFGPLPSQPAGAAALGPSGAVSAGGASAGAVPVSRPMSAMPGAPARAMSAHTPGSHGGAVRNSYGEGGLHGTGVSGGGDGGGALTRPMTARPVSRGGAGEALMPTTPTTQRAGLVQYPGGSARLAAHPMTIQNTWPSQQHDQALGPVPSSPGSVAGGRLWSAGLTTAYTSTGGAGVAHQRPGSSPVNHSAGRPPSSSRGASPSRPHSGAPLGFGSTTGRSTHRSPNRPYTARGTTGAAPPEYPPVAGAPLPPAIGALTARGDHVNVGARGAPLMLAQLQRENEILRDQLTYQHELAEASAAKVRLMEREAHVVTTTFDNRKHELEHVLACTREELERVKRDRDQWQERCVAAESRASELEHERATLRETVESDRATTLSALREYQTREQQNKERLEQLETEVVRLSTNLKMETTAVNSLKRQLVEFSDIAERNKNTLRDADLDPALTEVMHRTNYLLHDQGNPTGEQYAIQKIFQHYATDLRAVFLFYCQLEQSFADHWPPSMGFPHWMLFCKDSETSNPHGATRGLRGAMATKTLTPNQCEELFGKFSIRDETASARSGKPESVLSYESFLCCILAAAAALRRADVPFLSEALRDYILRYLSKARRVTPQGMGRGALRGAVEGSRAAHGLLCGHGDQEDGKKKRTKSAAGSVKSAAAGGGSRGSSRPASANLHPQRLLAAQGNSAVMKELAMLSLSGPNSTSRELLRTGGGFSVAQ